MSQKLYELALEIQGRLDGSFASAMKSAQGDIKTLEAETKAWQDRQKKVGGIDAAYIRAREGARKLSGELVGLKRQQDAISRYQGQVQAISQTAKAYKEAQRQVKALTAAYAKDKTAANKKAMQDAAKQAKTLEKQYAKNQAALKKMGTSLKDAGINTRNLGAEQANLARKIAEAEARQKDFNATAERMAHRKANWANMTESVRKYVGHVWRATKLTAAFMSSVAGGAFVLAKSTAERGDKAAKTAKKLRTSIEDIQRLWYASSKSGVKDIDKAIADMSTKAAKAAEMGTGPVALALTKLDLKFKDWGKFAKAGAVKQLLVVAEQLQKLSVAEQHFVLKNLFGDQWGEMKEFFKDGPEQIEELMKKADKFGQVLDSATSVKSEPFMDDLGDMQAAIIGLKNTIGKALMPTVHKTVNKITEWIVKNRELVAGKVADWIERIIGFLEDMCDWFADSADSAGKFLDIIGGGAKIVENLTSALGVLWKFWLTKKAVSISKWIVDTSRAMSGLGAGGGGAAMAAETAAGGAATAAARGVAAKGAAAGAASTLMGMLPQLTGIFGALTLFSEAAKRTGAVELANKTGEKFGLKNAYNASDIEWAIASKTKETEKSPKEPSFDALEALDPTLAQFRAKQALPQPQAIARMTPPAAPSGGKDTVSPLPDEQVKPFFDIVSITKGIEEQSKQRVSQEDFTHYGTVIASYLQGNEQAIRDLPERLRPIVEKLRPVQPPIIEHHARGGFVSTPTISTLAERGGEMVVPTADADRSLGISRLVEAARKLGVPTKLDIPKLNIPTPAAPQWDIPKLNIPAPAAPQWDIPKLNIPTPAAPEWDIPKLDILAPAAPKWDIPHLLESLKKTTPGTTSSLAPVSMPNINLSQTFTITGTDAQGIVEQFGPLTKQAVIEAMQEYQDEMRRVDYGT